MNILQQSMSARASSATAPSLRVGFVLTPSFTLVAFAGLVDLLRLASDEGDRSQQRLCSWKVLGEPGTSVLSSCGVAVRVTDPLEHPDSFDYIVVVGGLLRGGQALSSGVYKFLRVAADKNVKLVGLCTGSFVLARAGLMDDYLSCVSWFHRDEFVAEFPECRVTSNQMFVTDRERLTCAGGTSVVQLGASIVERTIGRASAVKALRIMLEDQPLPSRTLQPEQVISKRANDSIVHKAMLLLEQNLQDQTHIEEVCRPLGIGRRQLERRFQNDVGLSPSDYRHKLRMNRAKWLLQNTDLDILEVGMECGFQYGTHFARTVRRALGATPTAIRAAGNARAGQHREAF